MPHPNENAIKRRMTGQGDARSMQGTLSRGNNVYRGGMPNAQSGGGPQFGRPPAGPPGGMPPGLASGMPQQQPPNPMAPIVQNMQQLQGIMPTPSGATDNPVIAALQQGGPPGQGGVGGNPGRISPEIMAAIVRRLGAEGGNRA